MGDDVGDDASDASGASGVPLTPAASVSFAVQQLLAKHRNRNRTWSTSDASEPQWHPTLPTLATSPAHRNNYVADRPATGRRPDPIGGLRSELDSSEDVSAVLVSMTTDINGNDEETEALSRLRCQSVSTEVLVEKYRRKNRCADYPGFAFGCSVFSSDTMMKFNIIKNELHNIMNNQLKRVSI